jgi:Mg/Co/Ni transporter MgtE
VPATTAGSDLLLALLRAEGQPASVVDEQGRLAGTLHPETACRRLTAERLPQLMIAGDLVASDAARVSIHAGAAAARALLDQSGARALPVVDDTGRLVGEVHGDDVVA